MRLSCSEYICQAYSFASTHPAWNASAARVRAEAGDGLCLDTSCVECVAGYEPVVQASLSLPRHVLRGMRRQKCAKRTAQFYGMCRESVDSFSQHSKSCCALTIFPCSFATKAIYIAIRGSLGRTIDRFFLVRTAPIFNVYLRLAAMEAAKYAHAGGRFGER